jgi:hypothetical protein
MPHIVALLAKAGHGKTTIAKHLEETYGTKTISLAGPLKRAAKAVMDFSDAQLWGSQADKEAIDPRYGFSARTFLQRLGTDGLRTFFGPDVHVDALLRNIAEEGLQSASHPTYVIDDVRFPNEVAAVVESRHHDGVCIKIVCEDAPGMAEGSGHASETGIDKVYPEHISVTVRSTRRQGVMHLVNAFERELHTNPKLSLLRRALEENRTLKGAA